MTQELTTIQNLIVDLSTEAGLRAVRADRKKFPLWKDYSKPARIAFLVDTIIYCNLMKHRTNYDKELIAIDAVELDNGLMKHQSLQNLTAYEIAEALKNGARGEYGEVQLTPDYLRGYCLQFAIKNKHVDRLSAPVRKTPEMQLLEGYQDFFAERLARKKK